MDAESWARRLGNSVWSYVHTAIGEDAEAQTLTAELLSRLHECGWRVPDLPAHVSREGTRVVFPGQEPAMTARGLLRHFRAKGHGWLILKVKPLLEAVAGPLLPQLQEIISAYETQCESVGDTALVPAGHRWFVGGSKEFDEVGVSDILGDLAAEAPEKVTAATATLAGPG